jgi:kynureninase
MAMTYDSAPNAGAFQIGTVPVLAAAPLDGALDVLDDAGGVGAAREKSLALTDYLVDLVDTRLPACDVGTPRAHEERGGHVAIEHPEAARVSEALRDRGVVVDYRPPNVVRVCPAPLYTRFEDVWHVVDRLESVLDERAYEDYPVGGGVT